MKLAETIAIASLSVGGVAGFVSQVPEAWDCVGDSGKNRTEWNGGDLQVPHCDDEYMSEAGNTVHDLGKLVALGGVGVAAAAGGFIWAQRRRETGATAIFNGS